jgi:hypothetical protein
MHAISERCALAVDKSHTLEQRQDNERSIKQSRGMSI